MMYISTDYVFDGQGTTPWQPDCKDYKPLNVYGETKLAGELAVSQTLDDYFIVRIAWVFGKNGNNFIKTMLNVQPDRRKPVVMVQSCATFPGCRLETAQAQLVPVPALSKNRHDYYHLYG